MAIVVADVINRIQAILVASSTPTFKVMPGEPIGLPADGSPFAAFWYTGRADPPEGSATLGNRMNSYNFKIMCFWHRRPELDKLENFETDIVTADETLRTAFWGDATLNDTADFIDVSDGTVDYGAFPNSTRIYRSLEFDLAVRFLEGEPVAE